MLLPCCFQADTQHQLHPTTFLLLFPLGIYYTTHKDGPKDSTVVAWSLKQSHYEPSIRELFMETAPQNLEKCQGLDPQRTTNKWASIIKASLIPPTITHSNWSSCLRPNFGLSILHTSSNPALTQSTSSLISDPPFDKSNFICLMVLYPNVNPTCMLMPSRISWHWTPCSTNSPFTQQTSGLPDHVVLTTNSWYTKPRARILAPGAQHVPNHMPTLNQSPATPFHKRTPWYLIWLNHSIL